MAEELPPGPATPLRGHNIISANQRFLVALSKRENHDTVSKDSNVEREIWVAIESVCRAHFNYSPDDAYLPFPSDVSLIIADTLSELLAGGEPESWRGFRRPGRPTGAPRRVAIEIECITTAVAYIVACKNGIVNDRSYNKTVRECFGVAASTVRSWVSDESFEHTDPSIIKVPSRHKDLATFLPVFVKYAGTKYRNSSRAKSPDAIGRR